MPDTRGQVGCVRDPAAAGHVPRPHGDRGGCLPLLDLLQAPQTLQHTGVSSLDNTEENQEVTELVRLCDSIKTTGDNDPLHSGSNITHFYIVTTEVRPLLQDYLTPATWVFPRLEELVIWNFESETNQSPFSASVVWQTFSCLDTLRLNNVLFSDLTTILAVIGSQILLLDIDNFSLEDSSRLVVSFTL